nr:hypothetical protein GCM10020093_028100 [Planobispora longispora]
MDSLTVGHRQVTVAMLQRADALLFTLSAQDQPVLRHELEFLAEAAERVQAIAFVLTKVEDSANWRTLMEENQARLKTFVADAVAENPARSTTLTPLLSAPWIPVSSKLAEAAEAKRREGRQERADALRSRSGMDALERHLRGSPTAGSSRAAPPWSTPRCRSWARWAPGPRTTSPRAPTTRTTWRPGWPRWRRGWRS